jgi:hypothetical protein
MVLVLVNDLQIANQIGLHLKHEEEDAMVMQMQELCDEHMRDDDKWLGGTRQYERKKAEETNVG